MRKAAAILSSKSTNDFRHVSACASDAACFFSRRLIHSASCAQLRPGPMHNSRCNANAKSTPKSYFMKTLRKNRGEGGQPSFGGSGPRSVSVWSYPSQGIDHSRWSAPQFLPVAYGFGCGHAPGSQKSPVFAYV